jgi:hypothetical protein
VKNSRQHGSPKCLLGKNSREHREAVRDVAWDEVHLSDSGPTFSEDKDMMVLDSRLWQIKTVLILPPRFES